MITDQANQVVQPFEGGKDKGYVHKTYTSIATNIHIALRYSLYLAASFVAIFIIARLTGLSQYTEFRFINYFLCFPIGFAAVQRAYRLNGNYLEYFNGMIIGFLTIIMGQFFYAVLFFIYLFIDPAFLQYLTTQLPSPLYYPRGSIFFVMMIEGLGAGAIISLTMMQYFKWKRGRWAWR